MERDRHGQIVPAIPCIQEPVVVVFEFARKEHHSLPRISLTTSLSISDTRVKPNRQAIPWTAITVSSSALSAVRARRSWSAAYCTKLLSASLPRFQAPRSRHRGSRCSPSTERRFQSCHRMPSMASRGCRHLEKIQPCTQLSFISLRVDHKIAFWSPARFRCHGAPMCPRYRVASSSILPMYLPPSVRG